MSEMTEDLVVQGNGEHMLLPSHSSAYVAIKNRMPGITILIHGVNDVGEAYPHQEEGICQGLNDRLKRGDIQPAEYITPPQKNSGDYTKIDVLSDPDKVYFQRKPESGTSPVIPFYWGFREETARADTTQKHGEYLDRFGNRLDKRYGKNGGPFANATTNIPDMFGKGFERDFLIWLADPDDPTHPLLTAPPRTYMVLAAQRLASLIRIIRKQSPHEPINIVAHSQGGLVTLLAHAILAAGPVKVKADTVVLNNTPYSLEEPFLEKFQTGGEQQTGAAREETLYQIVKNYIGESPIKEPPFDAFERDCDGAVGKEWKHDANKERDNRGKVYLYFSPEDGSAGLPNVQGIGWWGVYDHMREKLGERFFQRVFTSPKGQNAKISKVGDEPTTVKLHFKWNAGGTFPRERMVSGEVLPEPFEPGMGNAELQTGPIDSAIAITSPYKKSAEEKKLPADDPVAAQIFWLNQKGPNSYHSSIVANSMHSRMATAYDLSVGISDILKNNDLTWMQFLRAAADWRTNWNGGLEDLKEKKDASFPPPPPETVAMLDKVEAAERDIILGNFNYYRIGSKVAGKLPDFTVQCKVESLSPYVKSETIAMRIADRQPYTSRH